MGITFKPLYLCNPFKNKVLKINLFLFKNLIYFFVMSMLPIYCNAQTCHHHSSNIIFTKKDILSTSLVDVTKVLHKIGQNVKLQIV